MEVLQPLTLPAKLDSLNAAREYVKAAALSTGLDEDAVYHLQLAVNEIATNIIIHGYEKANLSGDLTIKGELTDEVLRITLEDSGVPFNPFTLKLPEEKDLLIPLQERPIGGLGVYLAINSADRFDYERDGNLNRNIFEMRLRKS